VPTPDSDRMAAPPAPTPSVLRKARSAAGRLVRQAGGDSRQVSRPAHQARGLSAQNDVLRRQRDEARSELRVLRRQTEVLRRQRAELRQSLRELRSYRTATSRLLGVSDTTHEEQRRGARLELRRLRAGAVLEQSLRRGGELDEACVATVRELLAIGEHVRARSFSQALLRTPGTELAGHVGIALVARHQRLVDLAVDRFAQVPEDVALRLVPEEYLDIAFRSDAARARSLALVHWDALAPSVRMAVVRYAIRGSDALAGRDLVDRLGADGADALTGRDLADFEWLTHWYAENDRAREVSGDDPGTGVTVAVLDYKQPDLHRQSGNLGDHIQTLGALTHLLAYPTEFTGDPALVGVLDGLRERIRPDLRHAQAPGDGRARVVVVNRDASSLDALPRGTWLVAFGWFMHTTFDAPYDFPFHEDVNPVFVSFHVQRRAMLTPEAVAYLKAHGPVGCRDWTTVYLLLNLGVDAFFSGCLTTTVDAYAPPADRPTSRPDTPRRAAVDLPHDPAAGWTSLTQVGDDVSRLALHEALPEALRRVDEFRTFDEIATSRLHCYLPATAVGSTVDFQPRRLADVRFDGLLGLTPGSPDLEAIQQGLREKLAALYGSVLAGCPADEVYAQWRALTAADVARARERLARPGEGLVSSLDVDASVAAILAERTDANTEAVRGRDDVVHVALAADRNLVAEVPVVVESVVSNTERPVHVWLLSRGYLEEDRQALVETFPGTTFSFLPCDRVDYGAIAGMLKHITVSTMDRLLLPLLLPDVDRVVYHDIDAVTTTDLGALYDIDLAGEPVAARSARASWAESGFGNVYRAANRLPHDEAFELRRRMFRELPYDFVAFNAGIMVLDLERMRRDDFCARYVPFVEHYGMNDQEVLNCYAGPTRTVLDPLWNAVPQQETVLGPRIIHWAGPAKPWSDDYVIHRETWDVYADRVAERAAERGVVLPTRLSGGVVSPDGTG
jgi:lipopolysaccharide biosynthesis glycosyltransferase